MSRARDRANQPGRDLSGAGRGSGRNTRRIIAAYTSRYCAARYVPVDVSGEALAEATALACRYLPFRPQGVHCSMKACSRCCRASVAPGCCGPRQPPHDRHLNQQRSHVFSSNVALRAVRLGDFMLLCVDLVRMRDDRRADKLMQRWSAAFTRTSSRAGTAIWTKSIWTCIDHELAYRPIVARRYLRPP